MKWRLFVVFIFLLVAACAFYVYKHIPTKNILPKSEGYLHPYQGWHILSSEYDSDNWLDSLSHEWDYFMIHDRNNNFMGAIGYVLTNPRNKSTIMSKLLPSRSNVAIIAELNGKVLPPEFMYFALENTVLTNNDKYFYAKIPGTKNWAKLSEASNNVIHLEGDSELFYWDLFVQQSAKSINFTRKNSDAPFTTKGSLDVGSLPGEFWIVDEVWPKARIDGHIIVKSTGENIKITNASGYREISWGTHSMLLDGWDFLVYSGSENDRVIMIMQSYHQSKDLDYLDVSFYHDNKLITQRFKANDGELGWYHEKWIYSKSASQCVPLDTVIIAQNSKYRVEVNAIIDNHQTNILQDAHFGSKLFFIQEQFPLINGKIIERRSGKTIASFAGQAGGEFSMHKSPWKKHCTKDDFSRFSHPLPSNNCN